MAAEVGNLDTSAQTNTQSSATADEEDDDVIVLPSPKKETEVIVLDDDDSPEPPKPRKPPPPPVTNKSMKTCVCILCGEKVILSSLGNHVNVKHSKLIVKGDSNIECKSCHIKFDWGEFVDHAQQVHKWSIVKNNIAKNPAKQPNVPPVDPSAIQMYCKWCKEILNVKGTAMHFDTKHKMDAKTINKAINCGLGSNNNEGKIQLPSGVANSSFLICTICNAELKFHMVYPHFYKTHRGVIPNKPVPSLQQIPNQRLASNQRPTPFQKSTQVQRLPLQTGQPVGQPQAQSGPVNIPSSNLSSVVSQSFPKPSPSEQVITLFRGGDGPQKNVNAKGCAIVKLAHQGRDRTLSIPENHAIIQHRVHTIAVKGPLDDIAGLVKSVTEMIVKQREAEAKKVPERTVPSSSAGTVSKRDTEQSNGAASEEVQDKVKKVPKDLASSEPEKKEVPREQSTEEKNREKSSGSSPEKSDSDSSPKKSSRKLNMLLELQKGLSSEELEQVSEDTPRRSSRRAKTAAKLKIKNVVENEIQDWRKMPAPSEYRPEDDEDVVGKKIPKPTHSRETTVEQYCTKVINGKKVLVPMAASVVPTAGVSTQGPGNAGISRNVPLQMPQGKAIPPANVIVSKPSVVRTPHPQTSPVVVRSTVSSTRPASGPVTVTVAGKQVNVITANMSQPATSVIQPNRTNIQNSVLQTSGLVLDQGRLILNQSGQLSLVQPSAPANMPVLQQPPVNFVQFQSPSALPSQNYQLVTTPQGQQVLLLTNQASIPQQVMVGPSQQNHLIVNTGAQQFGPVAGTSSFNQTLNRSDFMRGISVPVPQQSTRPTILNHNSQHMPQRGMMNVVRNQGNRVTTVVQPPASKAKLITKTLYGSPYRPTPGQTVSKQKEAHSQRTQPDTVIDLEKENEPVSVEVLSKRKDGFISSSADMSVSCFPGSFIAPSEQTTAAPPTDSTPNEYKTTSLEEDLSREDLHDAVAIGLSKKKISPSDFKLGCNVIFECGRCSLGFPTCVLLKAHIKECFSKPPVATETYKIKLPFILLQKYFSNDERPGGVVSCTFCNKIIGRANEKDIGPLHQHAVEHQKNPGKGGSVTFSVISLTKVAVLKCDICGERVYRLWQDTVPLCQHLNTHLESSGEILCHFPLHKSPAKDSHFLSKKAYTWIDYIVPPFTMDSQPISEKRKNLDMYVRTSGALHLESLLPRRKRQYQGHVEVPKLRNKIGNYYTSSLKPIKVDTEITEHHMDPGVARQSGNSMLLKSIKTMPSPIKNKFKSTLTASIPYKSKHKSVEVDSKPRGKRKIFRQGTYRSQRLQEKREKHEKELREAEANNSDNSGSGSSTPTKMPQVYENAVVLLRQMPGMGLLPVSCTSSVKNSSQGSTPALLKKAVEKIREARKSDTSEASHTGVVKDLKKSDAPTPTQDEAKTEPASDDIIESLDYPHSPGPEPMESDNEEPKGAETSDEKGEEKESIVVPDPEPEPPKPESPIVPLTEEDIMDYLKILIGSEETGDEVAEAPVVQIKTTPELPSFCDATLADYFGDTADSSLLSEPLVIEQVQAPMYFSRTNNSGGKFRCAFAACDALIPNNTLVMLAHLSQHFRVRIAGEFSQSGAVVGHRRTCKPLPLTLNQVAAHFKISEREEASLHGGEVQMTYVCQWRNCSRTRTFKKGMVTHLYRHVTFSVIDSVEYDKLRQSSKPLKLSSAQVVTSGSGTKLVTEPIKDTLRTTFGQNSGSALQEMLEAPSQLDMLSKAKSDNEKAEEKKGNYNHGTPLANLIQRLTKDLFGKSETNIENVDKANDDPDSSKENSVTSTPEENKVADEKGEKESEISTNDQAANKDSGADDYNDGRDNGADDHNDGKDSEANDQDGGKDSEANDQDGGKDSEAHDHDGGKDSEVNDHDGGKDSEANDHDGGKDSEANDHDGGKDSEANDHDGGKDSEANDHDDGKDSEENDHDDGKDSEANDHDGGKDSEANDHGGDKESEVKETENDKDSKTEKYEKPPGQTADSMTKEDSIPECASSLDAKETSDGFNGHKNQDEPSEESHECENVHGKQKSEDNLPKKGEDNFQSHAEGSRPSELSYSGEYVGCDVTSGHEPSKKDEDDQESGQGEHDPDPHQADKVKPDRLPHQSHNLNENLASTVPQNEKPYQNADFDRSDTSDAALNCEINASLTQKETFNDAKTVNDHHTLENTENHKEGASPNKSKISNVDDVSVDSASSTKEAEKDHTTANSVIENTKKRKCEDAIDITEKQPPLKKLTVNLVKKHISELTLVNKVDGIPSYNVDLSEDHSGRIEEFVNNRKGSKSLKRKLDDSSKPAEEDCDGTVKAKKLLDQVFDSDRTERPRLVKDAPL